MTKSAPSTKPFKVGTNECWLSEILKRIERLDYYVRPVKLNALKLDSNENFVLNKEFISKVVMEAVQETDLREYPLEQFDNLYAQLAKWIGIDEKYIAVGNGSDQIIELLLSVIGKDRTTTVFTPTFSYFLNRCELHSIQVDRVPLNRDFALNKTVFLKSAVKSDLVYICSPNNPTGNQFDKQTVIEIIESLGARNKERSKVSGGGKLILIDEAYVDFADYSMAEYATRHDNGDCSVIVLRTMSKAFGLAGARVGYMITNQKFSQLFRSAIQSPYPVSSLSLSIATHALMNSSHVVKTIEIIRQERKRMFDTLSGIKAIRTFRSDANFLFIAAGKRYDAILKALWRQRIAVKRLGAIAEYRGCMRVTIGTKEMNDSFLRCVEGAEQ